MRKLRRFETCPAHQISWEIGNCLKKEFIMGIFDKNKFASENNEYETPDELFERINNIFHFTRDIWKRPLRMRTIEKRM